MDYFFSSKIDATAFIIALLKSTDPTKLSDKDEFIVEIDSDRVAILGECTKGCDKEYRLIEAIMLDTIPSQILQIKE